jgi:alcohol dehydrogenase YqhD (iron-dependent ADH family)
MNNFAFHVPTKIYFGKGQASHLAELADYGKSVLMVYGGGSIKKIKMGDTTLYDGVRKILADAGLTVHELSGIAPNPKIQSVREGAAICKEKGIDMVLAVGGGSTIDAAKLIAAAAKYDGDAWQLVHHGERILDALPIFTVLTLSATGTEMNRFSVISDMTINEKWGTSSVFLKPEFSVLDPELTYTVSARQTAAGTADIMSHVMECYFTKVDAFLQARFSEAILKTCIHYGPRAIADPYDYEARANLMWSSSWALNGLVEAGGEVTWGLHPIEHELSAYYDIVHGEGLAVLTPVWMRFAIEEDPSTIEKFAEYGVNVWGIPDGDDKLAIAKEAIERTDAFFRNDLKIPMSLKEIGVPSDEFFKPMSERAAESCKADSTSPDGSYVKMSPEAIEKILRDSF